MMKDKGKEYSKLYTEIRCIGKGNFGTAHLVKNNEDHSLYIAKKIPLDALSEKEIETSFGEATLLKNLANPHIVSYKNSFCEKRVLIIVMEYCENGDLGTLIKKKKESGGRFTESEIMHWFVQICMGLNYIHSMRIMHRDLKASNIFLTKNNCVKIGDFGISKVLQGTLEAAMTVVGTPYYMSPEVCQNKPYTMKSDIWALGCLLYELCTLEHPFRADNLLSLVYKIVKEEYDPIPEGYSQELTNLMIAMLLKDDADRPTTSNILDMPLVEKYMKDFIQTKGTALKNSRVFERQATATAHIQQVSPPKKPTEENKGRCLTAKERLMLRKEEEARKKFDAMTIAAKDAHPKIAESKQRKQHELFYDNLSPHGYKKQNPVYSPSKGVELKPAGLQPIAKPSGAALSPVTELTQTTFDINDRSMTLSDQSEDTTRTIETMETIRPGEQYERTKQPAPRPETVGDRPIQSKGVYDIDAVLAAAEYPEDFESEDLTIGAAKKEDQAELNNIMDSFKRALTRKAEDKIKEQEEFKKIENEQKAAAPASFMSGKKAQCISVLGQETYNKVYGYIKNARRSKMDPQAMQKELKMVLGEEKVGMAFFIEQIIFDEEMKKGIYV